ncbi:MAG TPA: DoxX-like family protein [Bacteroidia bacterium]|nr:DoxX-like family protein [Bacteroidia bacterium]
MPPLLRLFFSLVWLANGLWAKLLDGVPRHREIVARILGEDHSLLLTRLIGAGEVLMAAWILSGIWRQRSAVAQIAAVLAMNVIEFLLARDLLLFGGGNFPLALAYVGLVAWAEFGKLRTA